MMIEKLERSSRGDEHIQTFYDKVFQILNDM